MKFFSLLFFGLALACSKSGDNYAPESHNKILAESNSYDFMEVEESLSVGSEISVIEKPQEVEQKIIKTAQLEFETKDLDAAHVKIQELVNQLKGYVQDDKSGKNYQQLYRTVTVRLPSQNFQSFIEGISEGVEYFDRKDITRQDVTEEFVDLEARLKAKRELENRYLDLLKKAKNVKEMLEIERELSNIREEIEAKQGRLNYLKNKVSLSSITLYFYKTTSETGVTVSYGQKMTNAIKGGWDGISVFFLGLLYLWPLFLIFGIAVFILRRYLKKKKAKN